MVRLQSNKSRGDRVMQGLSGVIIVKEKGIWQGNALSQRGQGIQHGSRRKYYCDEAPSAKAFLMANLSNYDSAVISKDFDNGL
ncbi:hypothetical protein Tco_1414170 [Tanacetum coccineum]